MKLNDHTKRTVTMYNMYLQNVKLKSNLIFVQLIT